jgi:hypothetical protein
MIFACWRKNGFLIIKDINGFNVLELEPSLCGVKICFEIFRDDTLPVLTVLSRQTGLEH